MKLQEMTDSAINQILDNIDESKLDEWSQGFVTSVRAFWKRNKKLSPKQSKRLAELWAKQHEPKAS